MQVTVIDLHHGMLVRAVASLPTMQRPTRRRPLFAMFLPGSLLGCAPPGQDVLPVSALRGVADPIAAAAATSPPPPDRARLIIASGRWHRMSPPSWPNRLDGGDRDVRGDLVINGTHVAFIQHGQTLVLDVPPGNYTLRWLLRHRITDRLIVWADSIPSAVVLAEGTVTAFTADAFDETRIIHNPIAAFSVGVYEPAVRREGALRTGLTPAVNLANLLAHAPTILSPQPERLAGVPGAQLARR
jgi:hypothetical protein